MRGMNLVTITDHNRIDGVLEIAHLPRTFVSEEITTYFPEDHCKVHVLALNITERQHEDIQKVRENIYDLVDYLVDSEIFHIVAHPLFSINERLTVSHFEKMLLLFKVFELNGARNDGANECLRRVLSELTPETIERLADKHGMQPRMSDPWRKSLTGGSDDHSSLNIARTYTEIPGADSLSEGLAGILNEQTRVVRQPSTPLTFAHNIYGIAYQFYRNRFGLKKYTNKDVLINFLDRSLRPQLHAEEPGLMAKIYHFFHYRRRPRLHSEMPESIAALVRHETGRILRNHPHRFKPIQANDYRSGRPEENWFDFVDQVSNGIMLNFAQHLMDNLSGADVFNIFHTVGSAGGLYAMLAPYFLAFSYFSQDREFSTEVYRHFHLTSQDITTPTNRSKVSAYFVDEFSHPQKFTETLNRLLPHLVFAEKKVEVLTCNAVRGGDGDKLRSFEPVGTYEHSDFPDQSIYFPPLLQMLQHCYTQNVSHIYSATPGPVGLAALAAARILKRPVYGTYHPSLLPYVPFLGTDESVTDVLERFTRWYYEQLDGIYVFTAAAENILLEMGVDRTKLIRTVPDVDIECFHPEKRNGHQKARHASGHRKRVVLAGESTHPGHRRLIAHGLKTLLNAAPDTQLVMLDCGKDTVEMKRLLDAREATAITCHKDAEVAALIATAEVVVVPGVKGKNRARILQAQAVGIPVVVATDGDGSGPVLPEDTGMVLGRPDAPQVAEAVMGLLQDPLIARNMGKEGRRQMEDLLTDVAPFTAVPSIDFGPAVGRSTYAKAG